MFKIFYAWMISFCYLEVVARDRNCAQKIFCAQLRSVELSRAHFLKGSSVDMYLLCWVFASVSFLKSRWLSIRDLTLQGVWINKHKIKKIWIKTKLFLLFFFLNKKEREKGTKYLIYLQCFIPLLFTSFKINKCFILCTSCFEFESFYDVKEHCLSKLLWKLITSCLFFSSNKMFWFFVLHQHRISACTTFSL